jgi:hypothetical protein
MGTPDLVTAQDVIACRRWLGGDWLDSRYEYRAWFARALGRPVTQEETDAILSCINGYGPHRFEDTWASVERSTTSFWRAKL